MDILTSATTSTTTIYSLTDNALNLINFQVQLSVFFMVIVVSLLVTQIVWKIFD